MSAIDHAGLMDRVYRHQRHFYDATRKYYLIARDPMLGGLNVPAGGSVLEIGCGTGRNLVKAAELYPKAQFFGIDISHEMLTTAGKAVVKASIESRTRLALADAAQFDPQKTFGIEKFDSIFISYAVSMIPSWQAVIANAVLCLSPGGALHIVDFGDLRDLPGLATLPPPPPFPLPPLRMRGRDCASIEPRKCDRNHKLLLRSPAAFSVDLPRK